MADAIEQVGPNCFVFRTSDEKFVQNELTEGRLRQGWSPEGTSLLNDNGDERTQEDWMQAYINAYQEEPSRRRYAILRRMLDMQVGDLVLCPNAPTWGQFTITKVSDTYQFTVAHGQDDFGHIITITKQRAVATAYNHDSVMISDLFRSPPFWSAVAQVQDHQNQAVLDAAERLLRDHGDMATPQDPANVRKAIYHEGRKMAAQAFMQNIVTWAPQQFEAAVGQAFERKGYVRLAGNVTRYGGDADHVFSMPIPGFEEMDLGDIPVLVVQVKHHLHGPTDDEGLEQLLNFHPEEDSSWEVRYRVLFSSADSFTGYCERQAERHDDVVLICGIKAGLFML